MARACLTARRIDMNKSHGSRRRMLIGAAFIAGLAFASATLAQGPSVEAARKEGKVVWYT